MVIRTLANEEREISVLCDKIREAAERYVSACQGAIEATKEADQEILDRFASPQPKYCPVHWQPWAICAWLHKETEK